ncbi:MAG: rod-binding protein [Geminicoccaceae bacterium]
MSEVNLNGVLPVSGENGRKQADAKLQAAAEEFEAVFLAQVLRGLSTGLEDSGPLADGDSDPFADMLQQEYAKLISKSGGVGIADAVLQEMLKMQEHEG